MSRKRRNKRRKQASEGKKRSQRRDRTPQTFLQKLDAWKWHLLVSVAAVAGFAVFIVTEFEPIDRIAMFAGALVCAAIAFFIVGTRAAVTATIEAAERKPSQTGWAMAMLGLIYQPYRPEGELPWRKRTSFSIHMERTLLMVSLPVGFVLAILRPKRTWPAIAWLAAALLCVFTAVSIAALFE